MVNALYPAPASDEEARACRDAIERSGFAGSVSLVSDHLAEPDIHAHLSAADLIVFPYRDTLESASGAIRFALASYRPVACTPLPIFDDVSDVVHMLPGTSDNELARGIADLLGDPSRRAALSDRQEAWLQAHDWRRVSLRLWNMLRAPPMLDLVEGRE
jgi:glycosyltransferase involved in cell wall biosynthesis